MKESSQPRNVAGWNPSSWSSHGTPFAIWCITAAFGAYFCMYGIRKPFTATTYEGMTAFGMELKSALVITQVFGYMLSKFIGIKVIAELPPYKRVRGILLLTSVALVCLLGFALIPTPISVIFLFGNGLMLGMVFGLVLGFLEGRRMTELLAAGLCASFILADGVTKSVGAWLIQQGVSETWMPFAAGSIFMIPLLVFLWMLKQIPEPDQLDQNERQERVQMNSVDRRRYFMHYALGLSTIILAYLLITLIRSIRGDFAPEIWKGLGVETTPELFSVSEMWIALGIMVCSGVFSYYRNNRSALFHSLTVCILALGLLPVSILALDNNWISPFWFMVVIGLGLYLPYVLVHTALFERIMAVTPDKGNIGYLMYLADSTGYLGYVILMLFKDSLPAQEDTLSFFTKLCWMVGIFGIGSFLLALVYFKKRLKNH
jgi:MFS family permease